MRFECQRAVVHRADRPTDQDWVQQASELARIRAGHHKKFSAVPGRNASETHSSDTLVIENSGHKNPTRSLLSRNDCANEAQYNAKSEIDETIHFCPTDQVSAHQLVDIAEEIHSATRKRHHNPDATKGVNSRYSDSARILNKHAWNAFHAAACPSAKDEPLDRSANRRQCKG